MKEKIVLGLSGGVDSAVAAALLRRDYEVHCLFLDAGSGPDRRPAGGHGALRPDRNGRRNPAAPSSQGKTGKRPVLSAVPAEAPADRADPFPFGRIPEAGGPRPGKRDGPPCVCKAGQHGNLLYPGGRLRWLALRGPVPPEGDFVDSSGRVLGRHRGIHHYTLGQRRGLRFSAGRRMYVSKIDPKTNRITLSEGDGLLVREALCRAPNWISGDGLSFPAEGTVKFRHTRREEPAIFTPRGDLVHIALNAPVRMPAPGQLAVFYQGDQVMGSGWLI